MGGGPPDFPQSFSCSAVLRILLSFLGFRLRDFHSLRSAFPKPFDYPLKSLVQSITPSCTHDGLGSFPFARRYSGNRCFFLFLTLLRCFSSGGSLCMTMDSSCSDRGFLCRVSPFRNLRIKGYLLLPIAYRSLSRLSHPWDSPGKNTGVGCHFLLQCMKVKSESEVTVVSDS